MSFVKVLLGRDDGKSLEVLTGIAPGDRVVLNVSDDLDEGMAVEVVEPKEKDADKGAPKEKKPGGT